MRRRYAVNSTHVGKFTSYAENVRADRLVSMLLLLDTHRHMTARELARQLEVSERTVYRDVDALSAAGVPIYARPGGSGGCYLPDGYHTRLTGLTPAEAQVLSLAGPSQVLADLGLRDAVDTAQLKLMRALPASTRLPAQAASRRVLIDGAGWDAPIERVPWLEALQQAVWQERQADLVYRRSDGATVERRVHPLGLVAKGSVWYLVASVDGTVRVYRAARLANVRVLERSSVRPPGFDLAAYWQTSSAAFKASIPHVTATVRVAPSALELVRVTRRVSIERQQPPEPDGWIELMLRFDTLEEARTFALGCGPVIEVLAPDALRRDIAELAAKTVQLYANGS